MSVKRLVRFTRRFFSEQMGADLPNGARYEGRYCTWEEFAIASIEAERSARPAETEGKTDDEVAKVLLDRAGEYLS